MGSSKRSLVLFLVVSIVLTTLAFVVGSARLSAESAGGTAVGGPLIHSGQTPRIQDFFAGESAQFTVSITNTGSIAFQTVTTSNATSADCNRNNLGALGPGQSTSFTCSRSNVTESYLNEIQVNGTTDATTVSHKSNSFVKVLKPELRITKSQQVQTVSHGGTAFFTVRVFNTSDFVLGIDEIDDSVMDNCDKKPTTISLNLGPGDSFDYSCSMANIQAPVASVITVFATNPATSQQYSASDAAWVEVLSLDADLEALPTSVQEPGDLVAYTVNLVNTGSLPLTLAGLSTNQFGNILDPGNPEVEALTNTCLPKPLLPTLQAFGGSHTCSFIAPVEGQPSNFTVILTATARDSNNVDVTATTDTSVTITDSPASMVLTLAADPPFINPPSRPVSFSIRVDNTSSADAITITELSDEFLGNLNGRGTCVVPVENIPPGFSYQCAFTATVSGTVGQQKSRTISVKAVDDDIVPGTLTQSKAVTVGVTDQPTQYNFMPNVSDNTPNNTSCGRPYPLSTNQQYYFIPPNTYDATVPPDQRDQHYFVFELSQSARVRVEMTNFVPRKGQLIVRPHIEGGNPQCGSQSLGRDPDNSLTKTVDLGTRPAGKYYIQIINDGPSNVRELYGLIIRVN